MLFKDATPLLRIYARLRRRQLARRDYAAIQSRQLLHLVRRAAGTSFGREHDFRAIRSVADYQARVPLRDYEAFWREYWEPVFPRLSDCTWPGTIPYFALTSGTTTGATKYIPCSPQMIRSNRRSAMDIAVHHLVNRPDTRLLAGKTFFLGGSTDLTQHAPGIASGDLSGIATATVPRFGRARYFPGPELALIKNWEEKIDALARASLAEDIRMLSCVPSWLLIFFDKLCQLHPEREPRLTSFYPNLELLVHGGVNFAPYRRRFLEILGSQVDLREVYPTSEGFVAVADRDDGAGLRLIADQGLFFEFVPRGELQSARPKRHWLADVETGVDYAIVLTTCAGLWSYVLGDTVKFVDLDPPRLLITGRTSYCLSAFGEHLVAEEVEASVAATADAIAASVVDYSVGPLFPSEDRALGGHLFIVEFAGRLPDPPTIEAFAAQLDRQLAARNADYEGHRAGGFGLSAPEVVAVRPGTFAAWMKSRGKLGGQHKVPRIVNDQNLLDNLREFVAASTPAAAES